MNFVTNEKLTIVGAAGMIGSNMAQTAIMMGLLKNCSTAVSKVLTSLSLQISKKR